MKLDKIVLRGEFMYSITLISTRHEEFGKCNSDELYKIIEGINPELIFEEIPPSYFDKYYIDKTSNNLETDTINKYLKTHDVQNIQVDSEDVPSDSFFQNHLNMLKRIEGLADVNGYNYRNFTDRNRGYMEIHGFNYLNSIYCNNLADEINDAIEKGLQKINDKKLFQTYKLWKDVKENRENEMLKNIYNYSKEHSYDEAIFTLGAGHRKSMMQKIRECEGKENFKLNWTFYND